MGGQVLQARRVVNFVEIDARVRCRLRQIPHFIPLRLPLLTPIRPSCQSLHRQWLRDERRGDMFGNPNSTRMVQFVHVGGANGASGCLFSTRWRCCEQASS